MNTTPPPRRPGPTRPPAALLFDLDGTLVDSEPLHVRANCAVMAQLGIPTQEADFVGFVGTADSVIWREMIAHHRLGNVTAEDLKQRKARFMLAHLEKLAVMPGARRLLQEACARQLPLAVVSGTDRHLVEAILRAKELHRFFALIVSGGDPEVAQNKPAPDPYLRALALLGLPPGHCLAFEDSLPGVRSAREAGLVVAAIPNEYTRRWDFSSAHLRLRSLADADLDEITARWAQLSGGAPG